MTFKDLNIIPSIMEGLSKANYTNPTPIQEQAIPAVLAGRDLLGCAQTGTGKTTLSSADHSIIKRKIQRARIEVRTTYSLINFDTNTRTGDSDRG